MPLPARDGEPVGPGRYDLVVTAESWRCPLCKALADDARQHLADVHGVGSGPDRFGLRDATRARPPVPPGRSRPRPMPPDDETPGQEGASDGAADPPLVWRRAPRPRPPRRSGSEDGGASFGAGQIGQPARLRKPRPPLDLPLDPEAVRPAKPEPLPPDAAVLRLICDSLDGVDAAALHDRLLALPGVESVAIDLYDRTVDLYLDRQRVTVRPLVALVAGRVRLPIKTAELHRAAVPGERLGDATRIYVVQ